MLHKNTTEYCMQPTKLRLSKEFILWYLNVGNLIVTGVIPFISLSFLNCKIYLFIQAAFEDCRVSDAVSTQVSDQKPNGLKRLNAGEIRQVAVLFGVVVAFSVCNVLRIVLNIEEIISFEDWIQTEKKAESIGKMCTGVQFWAIITADISHFLLQVNASVNFFIYCILNKHFRMALKGKLIDSASFAKTSIGIM